jgi:hypothetical protein
MAADKDPLKKLRIAALIAALAGAVFSITLMFLTGQNPPLIVVVGFIVWVLAPWTVLALANLVSTRWTRTTRVALYAVTFVIAIASLAIYAYDVARPPQATRAFWWVAVPPASVLLTILVVGTAALISPRQPAPTN